jgi:hypothetical protein
LKDKIKKNKLQKKKTLIKRMEKNFDKKKHKENEIFLKIKMLTSKKNCN